MNVANTMNCELAQTMRECMPIAEQFAYFDHAAVAPLSGRAASVMATWLQQASQQGDALWPQWAGEVENTRNLAAEILGTSSQQIALVPNTSMGINIVAHGFPWNSGDNIVTLSNEFPANQYPWMNLRDQGVEVRVVEVKDVAVDIQQILDTCDARTRLITVSWVSFCTGYRMQLEELIAAAHVRGILVFLDAIQGIGVFPLDVEQLDVDFVAADGHKWMLGPEGAGIFYLKQSHLDFLRPVMVGWNSVKRPFDFDQINWQPRPTATRFEGGSNNMVGLIGLGASLTFLKEFGLTAKESPIAEQILDYIAVARTALVDLGAELFGPEDRAHQSGILSFDFPGEDLSRVRQLCMDNRVVLSCRAGRLRISPHAYNNRDDLDRLLNVLSDRNNA